METNKKLSAVLQKLHKESDSETWKIFWNLRKGIFRPLKPEDMKDTYIALSAEQGKYIYDLVVAHKSKRIVEFGTSFGISTLYLAAAAKKNNGSVVTTEILPEKVKVARKNFADAGMSSYIEVREGDALKTLEDSPEQIDFIVLDGWADLYVPLLKKLEPRMKDGCIIITDNTNFSTTKKFVYQYLRENTHYYSSAAPVGATEFSVFKKEI